MTNHLLRILKHAELSGRSLKDRLWSITARDATCILILFAVSFFLRAPLLSHPGVTEYDEVTYANYAMHMLDERPFVDIHPPLARICFAEIARMSMPFTTRDIPMEFNAQFGDFPIQNERLLVALFGILLPLIIYFLARILDYHPRVALLLGLFVATDNALIIYSRVMLPDMLLLCFDFLALLFALRAVRETQLKHALLLTIATGVSIGLALSIKWTALGMLLVIFFIFLLDRKYRSLFAVGLIVTLVYIVVFTSALYLYFPNGGTASNFTNDADDSIMWVAHMQFPKIEHVSTAFRFLYPLHFVMMEGNQELNQAGAILKSQGAYSWPIARNALYFWKDSSDSQKIVATGNSVLWTTSFFALLFDLCSVVFLFLRTRKFAITRVELILLFGYFANYLPFLLIRRPMYLYHYFVALLFLILLLPKIIPRILRCLALVTQDRLFAVVFITTTTILIFVNFFILLPVTYGF